MELTEIADRLMARADVLMDELGTVVQDLGLLLHEEARSNQGKK